MPRKTDTTYNTAYMRRYRKDPAVRARLKVSRDAGRKRNFRVLMLRKCAERAKKKGLHFSIKPSDLQWSTHCPVFGVKLLYGGGQGLQDCVASIDRKNSKKGYVPGNVWVISFRANRLKQDASASELKALLRYMET